MPNNVLGAAMENLPPCPRCKALQGDPCRAPSNRTVKPHRERGPRKVLEEPWLKAARINAGITQAELAQRSGVHRSLIGQIEIGYRLPNKETHTKLEHALGNTKPFLIATKLEQAKQLLEEVRAMLEEHHA